MHELGALAQVRNVRPKVGEHEKWYPMHRYVDVFLPDRLLESLVSRGFVEISTGAKKPEVEKAFHQRVLPGFEVDPTSSEDEELVEERFSLTEKGISALKEYPDLYNATSSRSVTQAIGSVYKYSEPMKGSTPEDAFEFFDVSEIRLEVENGHSSFSIGGERAFPRREGARIWFPEPFTKLSLVINGIEYIFENAECVYFLDRCGVLVVRSFRYKDDALSRLSPSIVKDSILYTAIKFETGKIDCVEEYACENTDLSNLPDSVGDLLLELNPSDQELDHRVLFTDLESWVFSCEDGLARHILFDYLDGMSAEVEKIAPLCEGDEAVNVRLFYRMGDEAVEALVAKLRDRGKLGRPRVKGVSAMQIVAQLSPVYHRSTIRDYFREHYYVSEKHSARLRKIAGEIAHFAGIKLEQVPDYLRKTFRGDHMPLGPVMMTDRCDIEYGRALSYLGRRNLIHPRWVNEFELYRLVKSLFDDAIYQYRPLWLGQQSLDIFIPSVNLAIEYQGAQHYQPVGIFGGEEGYGHRVDLDARKAALCESHGVNLYCWDYREAVKLPNVKRAIQELGIDVPSGHSQIAQLFDVEEAEGRSFSLKEEMEAGEENEKRVLSLGKGELKRLLLNSEYVKGDRVWRELISRSELVAVPEEHGYCLLAPEDEAYFEGDSGYPIGSFERMCGMAIGIRVPLIAVFHGYDIAS